MKVIEIKNSAVSSADKWDSSKYTSSGIWINTDESGIVKVMYVNKPKNWVVVICSGEDFEIVSTKQEETQNQETVSTDFVLKILAIKEGKVNNIEL